jgi:hypothetical protein
MADELAERSRTQMVEAGDGEECAVIETRRQS